MKKYVIVTLIFTSIFSFSQKIKLDDGIIKIEGKEWANYKGCGFFSDECSITKGNFEIFAKVERAKDIKEISSSNPNGNVSWLQVKFIGLDKIYEQSQTYKSMIKDLYNAGVFNEDNTFNEEAINKLVEKKGNSYSRKYFNF